jgi:hypothetical protein
LRCIAFPENKRISLWISSGIEVYFENRNYLEFYSLAICAIYFYCLLPNRVINCRICCFLSQVITVKRDHLAGVSGRYVSNFCSEKHTYIHALSPKGSETFQIFLRETHILPKLLMRNTENLKGGKPSPSDISSS